MNTIIFRVANNPKSNSTYLCFTAGMKPFVMPKTKLSGIKPGKIYLVDLVTKLYANGTKVYVNTVYNHGELTVGKPAVSKGKKKS